MPDPLPPVCVLAGGLGTRLGAKVRDTPKPLLELAGEPFLVHQLRLLARHGARRAVISVGYLGELIEQRIGHERFGVQLQYSYDGPSPLGTLGAIRKASDAARRIGSSCSTATRTSASITPTSRKPGRTADCRR